MNYANISFEIIQNSHLLGLLNGNHFFRLKFWICLNIIHRGFIGKNQDLKSDL